MNERLLQLCQLFVDNRNEFRKVFKMGGYMLPASAALCTNNGIRADEDTLKLFRQILKKQEGVFSMLRGMMEEAIVASMAMSDDPEGLLDDIRYLEKAINGKKVFKSSHSILAALIIIDGASRQDYDLYVTRTKEIFEQMKKDHSFLTGDQDLAYAALLAVSNINLKTIMLEMEEIYKLLKGKIFSAPIQQLSHVLALDLGAPGSKAERFLEMRETLKEMKLNFGNGEELSSLAMASLLDDDEEVIIQEISEAYELIRQGTRGLSMGKYERLSYAAMMTVKSHLPDDHVVGNVLMIIALQNAIEAAAAAAAAA